MLSLETKLENSVISVSGGSISFLMLFFEENSIKLKKITKCLSF